MQTSVKLKIDPHLPFPCHLEFFKMGQQEEQSCTLTYTDVTHIYAHSCTSMHLHMHS